MKEEKCIRNNEKVDTKGFLVSVDLYEKIKSLSIDQKKMFKEISEDAGNLNKYKIIYREIIDENGYLGTRYMIEVCDLVFIYDIMPDNKEINGFVRAITEIHY